MLLLVAISCLWRQNAGRRALMAALVVLATVCVLSIFFFPAHQGPYTVTHGPVTEVRGLLPPVSLFLALVLLTVGSLVPSPVFALSSKQSALGKPSGFAVFSSLREVFRC